MINNLNYCEIIKKNICISKDNPEDLIEHNGRLFISVELVDKALSKTYSTTKEELMKLICEATQKTNYNCESICEKRGSCAYCLTIVELILQKINTSN